MKNNMKDLYDGFFEQQKCDWHIWHNPDRKKEPWEILTPEQKERYDKELASDNWKKYVIKE